MTISVRTMSSNMDRLESVVANFAEEQRNSSGTRRNPAGSSSSCNSGRSGRRSNDDDAMDVDGGELADVDRPLPVPKKPRTGPKLKGLPVKRDPKRKALLV